MKSLSPARACPASAAGLPSTAATSGGPRSRRQVGRGDLPFDLPGLGRRNGPTQAELDDLYDGAPVASPHARGVHTVAGLGWLSGYAVCWNNFAIAGGGARRDGLRHRFTRGCFAKSLRENQDIALLYNHEQVLRPDRTWVELAEGGFALKVRAMCRAPPGLAANGDARFCR